MKAVVFPVRHSVTVVGHCVNEPIQKQNPAEAGFF